MKTVLNKLIKETPCRVVFEYTERAGDFGRAWFRYGHNKSFIPKIVINKEVSTESKIADLLHENIHAEHYLRNCRCFITKNRVLQEYHAMSGALRKAVKLGNKQILFCVINSIDRCENAKDCYVKAGKKIKKLKIYEKAKILLAKARCW